MPQTEQHKNQTPTIQHIPQGNQHVISKFSQTLLFFFNFRIYKIQWYVAVDSSVLQFVIEGENEAFQLMTIPFFAAIRPTLLNVL